MAADPTPDQTLMLIRWLLDGEIPQVVVLGCANQPRPRVSRTDAGVRLDGCLADADVGLPAQLLACGAQEVQATACPDRPDEVTALVAHWAALLDGVSLGHANARGRRGRVLDLAATSVTRATAVSRRRLLGLTTAPAPLDLTLDQTGRALQALQLLRSQGRARAGEPPAAARLDAAVTATSATVAAVLRAEGCIACGTCVRACPHDALDLTHIGDQSVLLHNAQACRGEQECVRLCPESVLSVTGWLNLEDLTDQPTRELDRVATHECTRCGTRHPENDGELCATCAFRRTNAFGSIVRTAPPRPNSP